MADEQSVSGIPSFVTDFMQAENGVTKEQTRPTIVGGDSPEAPFPIRMGGEVQHGFKRGSRELGCHTGESTFQLFDTGSEQTR